MSTSSYPPSNPSSNLPTSWIGFSAPIVLIILSGVWFYKEGNLESGIAVGASVLNAVNSFKDYLKQHRAFWYFDRIAAFFLIVTTIFGLGFFTRDTFFPSANTGVLQETIVVDPDARYSIRLYNCDDVCQIYVDGRDVPIIEVIYGKDGEWEDITRYISDSKTSFRFQVINTDKTISYGLQIRKNDDEDFIAEIKCGVPGLGCNNGQDYPKGVVFELLYQFVRP